ncbi:hypothetical protein F66182_2526 [Fusarium sp. NRRL 66182]|nr:hypothetical protein F66182_2526 [Fusarium sp. NRRL 66182]
MSAAVCGMAPTNNQTNYRVTIIVPAIMAAVFVAMRIAAKTTLSLPWGVDDTLIVVSYVSLVPFVIVMQIMITLGLGLDMWVLSDNQITLTFKLFIYIEIIYLVTLILVKASILCFFLRIFPDNKFRIVVKCTLAFNLLMGIPFFVLVFFQTRPFSMFWEGWQKQQSRAVMNGIVKVSLPHAALNLLLDVWMLVLPLSQLWELGLKLRKKLGVIAMFGVGVFLTIVAAIRIHELVLFASSRDLTVINAQTAMIWSSVELSVGIMVACMPHVRQLIQSIVSRLRKNKEGEKGHSNQGIFVDRSLATITVDDTPSAPELHDEGGLVKENTTTTTTTSRNTGSASFSSNAETHV